MSSSLREMMLRDCFIGNADGYKFTIRQNAGYIVFDWGGGNTSRLEQCSNWVDSRVKLPNGSYLTISKLFS